MTNAATEGHLAAFPAPRLRYRERLGEAQRRMRLKIGLGIG
jgi:hypothetical protein